MPYILEGKNVSKRFGGLQAVKNVHFHLDEGEILGLIGPNGSGKTTLFNTITGVYTPDTGSISFKDRDISGKNPNEICRLGIARTYQIPKPFPGMTALSNVMVAVLFGRSERISKDKARSESEKLLELVGLLGKKDALAKDLNGVQLRQLEMARALGTDPDVLLLDETMAGLNPSEIDQTLSFVRQLRKDWKISILMVEHQMRAVMTVSDRIMVLHQGEKIAEGLPGDIANNAKVIEAYLGEKYVVQKVGQ